MENPDYTLKLLHEEAKKLQTLIYASLMRLEQSCQQCSKDRKAHDVYVSRLNSIEQGIAKYN